MALMKICIKHLLCGGVVLSLCLIALLLTLSTPVSADPHPTPLISSTPYPTTPDVGEEWYLEYNTLPTYMDGN